LNNLFLIIQIAILIFILLFLLSIIYFYIGKKPNEIDIKNYTSSINCLMQIILAIGVLVTCLQYIKPSNLNPKDKCNTPAKVIDGGKK